MQTMLNMISVGKWLPIVGALASMTAAYVYHTITVSELQSVAAQARAQSAQLREQNSALTLANEQNQQTIDRMIDQAREQAQQISRLYNNSAQWEAQAREAMRIFAEHDFARLALLKPGLVQRRVNDGTAQAFRDIESITQPTSQDNQDDASQTNTGSSK